MTRPHVPQEILDAAHARKAARLARAWAEADRLKAVIEEAGWRVVDRGADFALSAAQAPDVDDGSRTRYGSSENVPSRLDLPDAASATVVIRAATDGAAVARAVAGLLAHSPSGTQVIVVGDGPDPEVDEVLIGMEASGDASLEVVWMARRLGDGASINIGLRRAAGSVVVLLDSSLEPTGDIVTPIIAALADPTVAVAGATGLVGSDVRDLVEAATGDVAALDGSCLGLRRTEAVLRGPVDERFTGRPMLATSWSLALRDAGEDEPARRAVALGGLPLIRHAPAPDDLAPSDRDRLVRRDRYRLLDRFGHRGDLLTPPAAG